MTQTHLRCRRTCPALYAGLAHPAVIDHLKSLNVTAIELMPVHQFMDDKRLLGLGLRNYWGYNTFGYFAPHAGYASNQQAGGAVGEFKTMVRAFHEAGIEVILDVVSTTTPAKATTSGRRSASAASTTPPITGCWTRTYGSTRTSPEPATASTSATRTPCS